MKVQFPSTALLLISTIVAAMTSKVAVVQAQEIQCTLNDPVKLPDEDGLIEMEQVCPFQHDMA